MPIDLIPEYSGDIPLIGQDSETFNANTAAKLKYDKDTFGSGGTFNVAVGQINTASAQVSDDAITASSASAEAVGATNYKGAWSSATGAYVSPASFLHNGEVWLLLVDVADITTTEPSGVNSDWLRFPSSAEQDANSAAISILQFAEYNSSRVYSLGDVVYVVESGNKVFYQWYSNVESLAGKDPSDTANRRVGWADITKPFYWKPYMPKVAGETMYWDTDAIPENMVVGIGQQLPVAVYHTLAAAKPEWIDDVDNTLINIPDRQGRFVRAADGTTWLAGETHEDAIRNITGTFAGGRDASGGGSIYDLGSGAIEKDAISSSPTSSGTLGRYLYSFDASRVVPTASEVQPKAYIEWVGYAL